MTYYFLRWILWNELREILVKCITAGSSSRGKVNLDTAFALAAKIGNTLPPPVVNLLLHQEDDWVLDIMHKHSPGCSKPALQSKVYKRCTCSMASQE